MSLEINCDDVPKYIRDAMMASDDKAKTILELGQANARARELTAMRMTAQKKLVGIVDSHPEGSMAGLDAIISNDTWAKANNANVEYTQKALQGYAEKFIPTLKENLSTTMFGLKRDKELGRAFVKAVLDGDTTNPLASKMAKEATESLEFLRTRFNKFGGEVGQLRKGGYLPQTHDAMIIRKTPKEEWVKFTRELVDEQTLRDVDLDYVYDTISTGGLNKLKEDGSGGGRGKSIANKHAEERVLNFKDGESWTKYQEKFGANDPLAVIDDHIRTMTHDMAAIEILGPNPQNMFDTMKDIVVAKRTIAGDAKPSKGMDTTEQMWNVVSGKVDRDEGKFIFGSALQTLRGMNTASLLTSASLSTITDLPSAMVNAGYHKMNPLSTLGSFMKNFAGSWKKANFREQQMVGLGADVFSSEITRRFSELGSGFWSKASEAVMRATMMNVLTESSRMAYKAQFFNKLLDGRKLNSLSVDEHISLLAKVQEEADYAVIMGNARSRAIATAGRGKGTIEGELRRTATQFMSFPMTFMVQHGARTFRQGNAGSKIAYGSTIFTLATLAGSIAMMSKDASKGFSMREGFDPTSDKYDTKTKIKFWAAAAAQGGGLGFLGDLFFSDQTRYGNDPVPSSLGPTAGFIEDAIKLTVGNVQEAFDPDKESTHIGSEAVEFVHRHMNPTKLFYLRAAQDQYLVRNLKILMDEDYAKAERRKLRKRKKDYGQDQQEWLQESKEDFTKFLFN